MINKIISRIFIIIGILIILVGIFLSIKNNSIEKEEDKPNSGNVEIPESTCKEDRINGNFKNLNITINNNQVNIKVLNCFSEAKADKGKKYVTQDNSYTMNIYEVSGNIEKNSKIVYQELIDLGYKSEDKLKNIKNNTSNKVTYSIVALIVMNEKKAPEKHYYNILYPISEESTLRVEIIYSEGKMEDGFLTKIEDSIDIKSE